MKQLISLKDFSERNQEAIVKESETLKCVAGGAAKPVNSNIIWKDTPSLDSWGCKDMERQYFLVGSNGTETAISNKFEICNEQVDPYCG